MYVNDRHVPRPPRSEVKILQTYPAHDTQVLKDTILNNHNYYAILILKSNNNNIIAFIGY